jgi:hypothetical protein
MPTRITPTALNDQVIQMTLDNGVYFVHLAYNSESDTWSMGLLDANSETLIDGLSLIANYPLLSRARQPSFPPGELMCIAPTTRETIDYDSLILGDSQLLYYSQAEVETAIGILSV